MIFGGKGRAEILVMLAIIIMSWYIYIYIKHLDKYFIYSMTTLLLVFVQSRMTPKKDQGFQPIRVDGNYFPTRKNQLLREKHKRIHKKWCQDEGNYPRMSHHTLQ
jgi:hypothetical protein